MSDLFGAPSGVMAFHEDQDRQVATQERFSQMQHLGALTEQAQMQTQAAAVKMEKDKRMLQIISQGPHKIGVDGEGNPQTPGDKMTELGTMLLDGGFVNEGGGLIYKADEMKSREAQQRTAALHAKAALAAQRMKQFDSLNNFIASAEEGPEGYAAAKMVWLNENPGEQIPPYLQEYNPSTIEMLKKATKAGQEEERRRQADEREADKDEYRDESLAERRRAHDATERHQRALERIQEERLAQRKKTGGAKIPQVGSAKNADLLAAQAMIRRDYPDLASDMPVGKDMVSPAAYDVANEAKALMTKNPGLSMPEAMTQVYGRMKQNGDFHRAPGKPSALQTLSPKLFGTPADKQEYKPAASEPALPFVKGVTKPEKDKFYDPGDGSKWRFDGKKMIEVE